MECKNKYKTIFDYRLKQWSGNIDTSMVNGGSAKAVFIIIPLIEIVVLSEFIWIKAFGGDIDKYKNNDVS